MDAFDIEIYSDNNGREPFSEWLKSIKDKRTLRVILLRLQRIRQGNFGDCKHFKGIHELRIDYGPGFRIYYAIIDNKIILLLVGGDKSSQRNDIKNSEMFFENYRRKGNA